MSTDPSPHYPERPAESWPAQDPASAPPAQPAPQHQQPWNAGPGSWQWPESQPGGQPTPAPVAGGYDTQATQQVWPNTADLAGPGVLPTQPSAPPAQPSAPPAQPSAPPAQPSAPPAQPQSPAQPVYQPPQQYQPQPQPPVYPPQPPQTYPPQPYPPQTYPPQTYPPQTYPAQTYPAQTSYPTQPAAYQGQPAAYGQPVYAPQPQVYPPQPPQVYPPQPQQQYWAAQPPVSSPPISIPPISGVPVSSSTPQPIYQPAQPRPQAQPEYVQQPQVLSRPSWADERATPTPAPDPDPDPDWSDDGGDRPRAGNRLVLGLLAGLLVGAAVAAPTTYLLKPTTTNTVTAPAPSASAPAAQPSPTLSVYEQARKSINEPKLSGPLGHAGENWLPYLGGCITSNEGGPAPLRGQSLRVSCKYSGVDVAFGVYESAAARDEDRTSREQINKDTTTLLAGVAAPGRKVGGKSKASGSYVEYAFKNGNNELMCGVWWGRDDDTASVTIEGSCEREFGSKWDPLRDLWSAHS